MSRPTPPIISPELVSRVACGDRDAFGRLYDLSSSLLFALAHKMLGDEVESTELLQEVYVEIWQKAGLYNPERGSPMSWVVTLTRSRALDRLRSKGWKFRTRTVHLDDQLESELLGSHRSPLESVREREMRDNVTKALSTLPKEQSLALELSYYQGLSHREIADRIQEPVGTVKTRIRLGVLKLRESLQSYWTQESA